MFDITAILTSCRRKDLLIETISSIACNNDIKFAKFIIVEDSDDESFREIADMFPQLPIEVIVNGCNLGQHRSIDRAYALVQTKYILHLEDDWRFCTPGVVKRALELLERDASVYLVQLRTDADMPRPLRRLPVVPGPIRYKRIPPSVHRVWYSFTFNPTVKRLSDYWQLDGGYAAFPTEAEISLHYKRRGAVMAWLLETGVTHIGDGRSNFGHAAPACLGDLVGMLRRFFSARTVLKWKRSAIRRLEHLNRLRRQGSGIRTVVENNSGRACPLQNNVHQEERAG